MLVREEDDNATNENLFRTLTDKVINQLFSSRLLAEFTMVPDPHSLLFCGVPLDATKLVKV